MGYMFTKPIVLCGRAFYIGQYSHPTLFKTCVLMVKQMFSGDLSDLNGIYNVEIPRTSLPIVTGVAEFNTSNLKIKVILDEQLHERLSGVFWTIFQKTRLIAQLK